jgi:predicted phosphate transport protein (TIGR00153 family)
MKLFKKEKAAQKLFLSHLHEVHEGLLESRNLFEEYLAESYDTARQKSASVDALESAADKHKREIRETLLDGAFLPHVRSDIYRVVEGVDSIVGKAEEITHFIVTQNPKIPEEYHASFLELYLQSLNCFLELRQALQAFYKPKGALKELKSHFNKVCELESGVDKLESKITAEIFGSSIHLSEKTHLQQLVTSIGDIADLCEDAADELEFAAMKSVV